MAETPPLDLTAHAKHTTPDRTSEVARRLAGSEILRIAADIRALVASGRKVCNLTVGDFDPRIFPIPKRLERAIVTAVERGETNYPPSNGVLALREAVQEFYAKELGLRYPLESVIVASGARPVIYGTYRAVVDPGEKVLFPTPSWNNNHYCNMLGAVPVPVPCGPETSFMPTAEQLRPHLPGARLLCLNTPQNPSGTTIRVDDLRAICAEILAENARREARGERPLYLMYDHIYWMLTFGGARHTTPPACDPRMARYTIFVDGISKAFAATGLRVGWAVGPADLMDKMANYLGHVGAWAPRAEQFACAELLRDRPAITEFHAGFFAAVQARLTRLHEGFQALRQEGFPCDSLAPQGAIYLSARIAPFGKRAKGGAPLRTNDDVRRHLLEVAGIALVPFQAFGVQADDGWFRLSVGAVTEAEIEAALPRLGEALRSLS